MRFVFPRFAVSREAPCKGTGVSGRVLATSLIIFLLVLLGVGTARPQSNSASPDPQDVLQFLNQTIDWYRQLISEEQLATEPTDAIIEKDDRRMADQVVRLSFDYARAAAQSLSNAPPPAESSNQGGDQARYQSLRQLSSKLDQQARETQTEIEGLERKLDTATGVARTRLRTRIAETQSELDLLNARKEAIKNMVDFVSGASASGLGATGLRAQIEALARSVPADLSRPSTEPAAPATSQGASEQAIAASTSGPSGIWGMTAEVFALSAKSRSLQDRIQATDALAQAAKSLRAPLINRLKDLSRQGDQLATQADTANDGILGQEKKQLDDLTAQFKQLSAQVLPLSKQSVLLANYKTSLTNWQSAVRLRYHRQLRSLLIRVIVLLIIIAGLFILAEIWRRTITRYVHDVRRRYQFLLLRKVVLWFSLAIVIAFAFASQLGSVATFAGLLTAGVAVALQNVILSLAGYFFLIGKFGIRVGDRVQIAGVTGEVIDIGLVRLHLMELGTDGVDAPTGRVVAFSNSIVFQPTAGVFKQIPGTHFVWHEIRLTLAPDSDYHIVETRLLGAVEAVFSDYREEMERQHRQLERTLSSPLPHGLRPKSRLRFTAAGLEAVIRYPVDLQHATEIDDRITRELLKAVDREPKLNLIGSGSSAIKITTDLSTATSS